MLSAAFFSVLFLLPSCSFAREEALGTLAVVVFIIAALTDILDGYLARRWNVVSVFGRVMDPFCDKLLVLGALVMLATPPYCVHSGIRAWMVVLILGRELYVTSVRAVAESQGLAFPADRWGKIKMFLQCVAIPFAIFVGTHPEAAKSPVWQAWRDGTIWAMVAGTVFSLVPYVIRSATVLKSVGGPR